MSFGSIGAGATTNPIPGLLTNYRAYLAGNVMAGTADVTLPDLEFLTETLKGAGIPGELEMVIQGHLKAMTANLKWRTIQTDAFALVSAVAQGITFRGAQQDNDPGAGGPVVYPVTVTIRAQAKKLTLGKFEVATATDSGVELAVNYLRVVRQGIELCEIDPANMKCVILGVDLLADIADAI